ncbi:MAG: AmmeMemoRadiSam system radical SAM enzyme [Candidatus Magasanikbacteria bacterium]|nr:AmmeMemoRadiSam system radical SAM enzyme [Candidatus Magasanikbacteria bacterium]
MRQAVLYRKLDGNKVRCLACAHYCVIQNGKTGICGVRKNVEGELQFLVYGRPAAIHVDPIEKKPLYHFMPGTEILSLGTFGCNFRCGFCQNYDISQHKLQVTSFKLRESGDWLPERIVSYAVGHQIPSIAYTYNEPTVFVEYAHDIMVLAKEKGIRNVFVSNGYESKETLDYIGPYLDAINIDLKSFSNEFYQKNCGAKLQPVLDTIKRVYQMKIWQEITTLVIPGENDSEEELKQIADFIVSVDSGIPWHLSRFHPDYKMVDKDITDYKSLARAKEIGLKAGLKYVYIGNV